MLTACKDFFGSSLALYLFPARLTARSLLLKEFID